MILRRSASSDGPGRLSFSPGYTLLEVITSLGIASFLVYAVYRTIELHYMYVETGRQKADNTQIVRSVISMMRNDLRGTFSQWTPTAAAQPSTSSSPTTGSSSTNPGSTSGTQTSNSTSSTTNQVQSNTDIPPGGVSGLEDSVSLIVRAAIREQDHSATGTSLSSYGVVTDTRMIQYYLEGSTLIRAESTFITSHATTSNNSASAKIDRLADNLNRITFQYYDGTDWLPSWDFNQSGAPRLIEVVLTFREIQFNADDGIEQQNPQELEYKFRIAVPDAPSSSGGAQ